MDFKHDCTWMYMDVHVYFNVLMHNMQKGEYSSFSILYKKCRFTAAPASGDSTCRLNFRSDERVYSGFLPA